MLIHPMLERNNKDLLDKSITLVCAFIKSGAIQVNDVHETLIKLYDVMKDFYDKNDKNNKAEHLHKDHFTCLICNKNVVLLNKHLNQCHDMDIKTYKQTFHLSGDYPSVPEEYSERRSKIAKIIKLGTHRKKIML